VARSTEAADRALRAGYLLKPDYDEAVARAQAAPVPAPQVRAAPATFDQAWGS
jgi:hypothetical protein